MADYSSLAASLASMLPANGGTDAPSDQTPAQLIAQQLLSQQGASQDVSGNNSISNTAADAEHAISTGTGTDTSDSNTDASVAQSLLSGSSSNAGANAGTGATSVQTDPSVATQTAQNALAPQNQQTQGGTSQPGPNASTAIPPTVLTAQEPSEGGTSQPGSNASTAIPPTVLTAQEPSEGGTSQPGSNASTAIPSSSVPANNSVMAGPGDNNTATQDNKFLTSLRTGSVKPPIPTPPAQSTPITSAPIGTGYIGGATDPNVNKLNKQAVSDTQAAAQANLDAAAQQNIYESKIQPTAADLAAKEALATQANLDNQKTLHDRATASALDTLDKAKDIAMQVANSHIDPNHYWNSKSTVGQISTVAGLILGSLGGAATNGVNVAAQVYEKAVDRDINAQQQDINNRKDATNTLKNLSDSYEKIGMDSVTAMQAATVAIHDNAATQLKAAILKAGGVTDANTPLGQALTARANAVVSAADTKNAQMRQDVAQKIRAQELQKAQAAQSYSTAANETANAQKTNTETQGMRWEQGYMHGLLQPSSGGSGNIPTPSGPARTFLQARGLDVPMNVQGVSSGQLLPKDDAKAINDAEPSYQHILNNLQQAQAIRNAHGGNGVWSGDDLLKMRSLNEDTAAALQRLNRGGQISERNVGIYNDILQDMNRTSMKTGNENALLAHLSNQIETERQNFMKSHGAKFVTGPKPF